MTLLEYGRISAVFGLQLWQFLTKYGLKNDVKMFTF